jgi:EAL domain-containing protein (putative c-di-GMP-specific phosphodiesterase class I)
MQDPEASVAILHELSALGVRISIDDFGTGYSSLSYLRRFPLNKVKIDRSFVGQIARSQSDAAIVRAIVSLAHSLELCVIAEGVETVEQLDFLSGIGCDQYQGYYCSPALSAAALEAKVRSQLASSPSPKIDLSADTFSGRMLTFERRSG